MLTPLCVLQCKPELTTYSLGSRVSMPAIFPADLAQRLSDSIAAGNGTPLFPCVPTKEPP